MILMFIISHYFSQVWLFIEFYLNKNNPVLIISLILHNYGLLYIYQTYLHLEVIHNTYITN